MGVRFWALRDFLIEDETGPSTLINVQDIVAHAVRTEAYVGNEAVWATLRLNRVCPSHISDVRSLIIARSIGGIY